MPASRRSGIGVVPAQLATLSFCCTPPLPLVGVSIGMEREQYYQTVILLHPPLPLLGVSIAMERVQYYPSAGVLSLCCCTPPLPFMGEKIAVEREQYYQTVILLHLLYLYEACQ